MIPVGPDHKRARPSGRRLPTTLASHPAQISPPTSQGLLRGMVAYRWVTLTWAIVVFAWEVAQRGRAGGPDPVAHPLIGAGLLALGVALNIVLTLLYRRDPDRLLQPTPILIELVLMAGLLMADVWVYGTPDHAQTIPSVAVLGGVIAAAIAAGLRAAVLAGFGLGLARYIGWLPYALDGGDPVSVRRVASWVLLMVTGWTAGYVLLKLEAADRSIATYRAREEVARTLHDGVLQTLAVVQRRSDDGELVELARTQELELREYLFGATPVATDLAGGLRHAARRAEKRYGIRVEVNTANDLPPGGEQRTIAVCGAVGEALTNSVKHGGAEKVVVYAEPATTDPSGDDRPDDLDPVFVSVKDDGTGFDPVAVREGHGLGHSIRGRIADVGGRVEVDGRPGRGTEIRIWV